MVRTLTPSMLAASLIETRSLYDIVLLRPLVLFGFWCWPFFVRLRHTRRRELVVEFILERLPCSALRCSLLLDSCSEDKRRAHTKAQVLRIKPACCPLLTVLFFKFGL